MTPLNAYGVYHHDTIRGIRRAVYLCVVLVSILIVLIGVAARQSWRSINAIVAGGDCAHAAYERAQEMDRMPRVTERQARKRISEASLP